MSITLKKFTKLNSKKSYDTHSLIKRLSMYTKEEKIRRLWNWIKSNEITYSNFHALLDYIISLEKNDHIINTNSEIVEVIKPAK